MPNIIVPLYCRLNNMLFDKFHTIRRNSILSRKTHTITQKSVVLRDSIISPQSPLYKRHPKTKKLGFTTHRDEPHQTSKSLDFKPFLYTFAKSFKNPMALFLNCRLCRCYTLMTFTPGVNDLPLLPHLCGIYPTPILIRQIALLPLKPLVFLRNPA